MGICAFCYMWNLLGVMVLQRHMLDWRRGWHCIDHWLIAGGCMLLYMKLILCSGFPEIYTQLEERGGVNLPWVYVHCAVYETYVVYWFSRDLCSIGGEGWGQSAMGICALCCIWNLCGVLVVQRSMLDWRRGRGQSVMKLMQCSGLPEIYDWGGSSSAWGMCILLWCSVCHRSMVNWGGGGEFVCHISPHLQMDIYTFCTIWCNAFPEIYAELGGSVCHIWAHFWHG